jgi:two-component system sensor histidine kinase DegS
MEPAHAPGLADLCAVLTATERHLLAGAEQSRELAAACGRPALAGVGGSANGEETTTASSCLGEVPPRVQELAAQLRELAATLVQQADALGAADGGSATDRQQDAARRLQSSEAERARLARELHDGPAQYFANAVFETEYLQKLLVHEPASVGEGLVRLRQALQQGVKEIRQCLFDLRLPPGEEMGLLAMLRGYLPEYERQYGVSVAASLPDEEPPLSADQAVAVFRILQESLTNVRKHSGAQEVRVKLRRRGGELVLQVEDNGRGFAPGAVPTGHYGLVGMRERAQLVGGRLEIQGRPGKGARVVLRVPIGRRALVAP